MTKLNRLEADKQKKAKCDGALSAWFDRQVKVWGNFTSKIIVSYSSIETRSIDISFGPKT